MTPLLPPVPIEMCTVPVHMLSRSVILALCVSCRNIMQLEFLIYFLILPIACRSLISLLRPLQLIVRILISVTESSESHSGPGLGSMPAEIRFNIISLRLCIFLLKHVETGILVRHLLLPRLTFLYSTTIGFRGLSLIDMGLTKAAA